MPGSSANNSGLNEFEIFETRYSIRRMLLAIGVGVTYFAIAAMESMPHRTTDERRLVTIVNIFILVVLAVLMFAIMRAWKERRRVAREWKSSQP